MTDKPTNPDDADPTARFEAQPSTAPAPVEPPPADAPPTADAPRSADAPPTVDAPRTADAPATASAPSTPPAAPDAFSPPAATGAASASAEQAPPPSRPWPPPTWRRGGEDSGRLGTIVFGAILLVIGLWFFADQTLGLEMPRLRWSQLWPLLLIGIGAWIAIGSLRRR